MDDVARNKPAPVDAVHNDSTFADYAPEILAALKSLPTEHAEEFLLKVLHCAAAKGGLIPLEPVRRVTLEPRARKLIFDAIGVPSGSLRSWAEQVFDAAVKYGDISAKDFVDTVRALWRKGEAKGARLDVADPYYEARRKAAQRAGENLGFAPRKRGGRGKMGHA
jgi:hypothetical protein